MVSGAVLLALIFVAGVVLGVVATIIVARIQAAPKADRSTRTQKAETTLVLGEAIDNRELRILRSLFGESKGRLLEAYKDKYYRPSLVATIDKGWVKKIGRRYYMTSKGREFCRTYLNQLLSDWQPTEQDLA